MPNKLRRGVLRTAVIGLKKVIPAMQQGQDISVVAIASGDLAKAQEVAGTNIAKVFFKMQEASSRA
jgi:predicted dehydrogenase